ncbi:MmgE/PrpD family-domain-containing protein [Usnea florida]
MSLSSKECHESYDDVLEDITAYVFHYQVDSSKAWARSRHALLDALGCALETLHTSPECVRIIGPVVPNTTVPNGFRLPGTSYELDPVKGAFDLGSLIRYLDHNDAYSGTEWGHPSDNIGALLAVTDWKSRSSIANDTSPAGVTDQAIRNSSPKMTLHTLLEALIKAYEIQGCLQELNSFNGVGLDHTILVKAASTAVVSWLLGCSEDQTLAALSQAFQDGHPLRTFRQCPNVGPRKGWAAGDACMRAVHLAILSGKGQPGASTVLTDPKWGFYARMFKGQEFVRRRQYTSWVIENVGFKLIPAEGHAISAVEATLRVVDIMKEKGYSTETDIVKIHIRTQGPACTIINKSGPLKNAADRDHCLQYVVAVILLKGGVIDTKDYMDDSLWASDQRVDDLRAKIQVVEDEQLTRDYYDPAKRSCSNAITIEVRDGSHLDEVLIEYPIGHVGRPDTLEQLEHKFWRNARFALSDDRIDEILRMVKKDDAPVHEFVDLFFTG